jgi:predicted site-specific integrase-resolvase
MINRYERLNQELKMVETKRKVAAYCRVSTDNEDQANSFESQQRYFRQYIERNPDWELYEIFADATVIIGLKQNPTYGRRFSPIFCFIEHF